MIENIQKLYNQLDHKGNFIKLVAKDLGKSTNTLAHHWFARFWSIPEMYHERVVELLQKTIKKQNSKQTA